KRASGPGFYTSGFYTSGFYTRGREGSKCDSAPHCDPHIPVDLVSDSQHHTIGRTAPFLPPLIRSRGGCGPPGGRGLYPGGGVWVWQRVVVPGGGGRGGEGAEAVVQGLHGAQGAGDHGDGVGRHQRHVVGRPPQRQRVVGRTRRPQDVVRPQRLHVVVQPVVLGVLHLQRHDLLLLAVRQVVGPPAAAAAAPLRGQPVATHLVPPVALVVERGEGQDVEEEEGGAHRHRDAQLRGVVARVPREQVLVRPLGALVHRLRGEAGVVGAGGGAGGRRRPVGAGRGVAGGDRLLVQAVQVRHQLQPEGHLVGAVVVADAGLQADVQLNLVQITSSKRLGLVWMNLVSWGTGRLGSLWEKTGMDTVRMDTVRMDTVRMDTVMTTALSITSFLEKLQGNRSVAPIIGTPNTLAVATAGATHWWSVNSASSVLRRMSPLSRSAQSVYMNLMVSL
ncbi:hypothetical protein CRUP_002060, partial [Coryphaenoides rupestris]